MKSSSFHVKVEQSLQAIVFTSSFDEKFKPITLDSKNPKCLLPLVNFPIIEYTLEALCINHISEIFLIDTLCTSAVVNPINSPLHSYLKNSRFASLVSPLPHGSTLTKSLSISSFKDLPFNQTNAKKNSKIFHILVDPNFTEGDCLRYLHDLQIIRSDPFLMLHCDLIFNIDLEPHIKRHKMVAQKYKEKQKQHLLLTYVVNRIPNKSETLSTLRPTSNNKLYTVYETDSLQLIDYQINNSDTRITVPKKFFENKKVSISNDLHDVGLAICSIDVLGKFSDPHLQFSSLIANKYSSKLGAIDCIHGILSEADLLNETIHLSIINHSNDNDTYNKSFISRVEGFFSYNLISKQIIKRFSFPLVPDANLSGITSYQLFGDLNYKNGNVHMSRSAKMTRNSVIGSATTINDYTIIDHSVIGNNCQIGKNCKIYNSYIWDNCKIEDNVTIIESLIANNVSIYSNSTVQKGSILSFNCEIGPNFTLPSRSMIYIPSNTDKKTNYPTDNNHKGITKGCFFCEDFDLSEDEDDEQNDDTLPRNQPCQGRARLNSFAPDSHPSDYDLFMDDDDNEFEDECNTPSDNLLIPNEKHPHLSLDPSLKSHSSSTSNVSDKSLFANEMKNTLERGENSKNVDIDSISLEASALKLAHNASLVEYADSVMSSLIYFIQSKSPLNFSGSVLALASLLKKWLLLFRKYATEVQDQARILDGIQAACIENNGILLFRYIIQILYDSDCISEDAIFKWEEKIDKNISPEKALFDNTKEFLDWLRNEEDDED